MYDERKKMNGRQHVAHTGKKRTLRPTQTGECGWKKVMSHVKKVGPFFECMIVID
jgi:hypothetical protein